MKTQITKAICIYKILSLFFIFTVIGCSSKPSNKDGGPPVSSPTNPTPSTSTPSYPGLEKLLSKAASPANKADLEALFSTAELKQCISDLVQNNAHLNNLLDTVNPRRDDTVDWCDDSYVRALCEHGEGLVFIKDAADTIYIRAFKDGARNHDQGAFYVIFKDPSSGKIGYGKSDVLSLENFKAIKSITGIDMKTFKASEAKLLPMLISRYAGIICHPTSDDLKTSKSIICLDPTCLGSNIFVLVNREAGHPMFGKNFKLDTAADNYADLTPGVAWKEIAL